MRRTPAARAAVAKRSGGAALGCGEAVDRALHRMDQVVGGVDAVQGPAEPGAADGVADHDVVERDARRRDPLARAGEAADLVAGLVQARHERRADVAGHSGDEHAHPQALPAGWPGKTPRERSRHVAGRAVFIPFQGYLRGCEELCAFCGEGGCRGLSEPRPGALLPPGL